MWRARVVLICMTSVVANLPEGPHFEIAHHPENESSPPHRGHVPRNTLAKIFTGYQFSTVSKISGRSSWTQDEVVNKLFPNEILCCATVRDIVNNL